MNIKIIYHFPKYDEKYQGDYYDMEVFIDDKLIHKLSDEYHDSSNAQIKGFLLALNYLKIEYKIEYKNLADRDY